MISWKPKSGSQQIKPAWSDSDSKYTSLVSLQVKSSYPNNVQLSTVNSTVTES